MFWRRRLLVLAGVIALVWIALQVAPGGSADRPAPKSSPTAAQPTAVAASDGTIPVNLSTDDRACDPQQVRVTPTVRPKQENRGAVDIGLVVSTTETTSCTLQPGDADLVAIISANDKAVWDSTVCKQSLLTEPVELSARWATFVVTEWSGRGSGSTCSKKEGWAPAGTYLVEAGTLGGEPGKASFSLLARPAPKATQDAKTDEPKKTEKPSGDDDATEDPPD